MVGHFRAGTKEQGMTRAYMVLGVCKKNFQKKHHERMDSVYKSRSDVELDTDEPIIQVITRSRTNFKNTQKN